jgi:hypothetical protein
LGLQEKRGRGWWWCRGVRRHSDLVRVKVQADAKHGVSNGFFAGLGVIAWHRAVIYLNIKPSGVKLLRLAPTLRQQPCILARQI